jgi:hypothetical protein
MFLFITLEDGSAGGLKVTSVVGVVETGSASERYTSPPRVWYERRPNKTMASADGLCVSPELLKSGPVPVPPVY